MTKSRNQPWPRDLVLVGALSVLTALLLIAVPIPDTVLWLLGIPFLIFFPGYALVAGLFPEPPDTHPVGEGTTPQATHSTGPGRVERLALTPPLSAIVLAVVGVILSSLGAISLGPVAFGVSMATVTLVVVAFVRRSRVDSMASETPRRRQNDGFKRVYTRPQQMAIALSLMLMLGSVVLVAPLAAGGDGFTESYVLIEGADGPVAPGEYTGTFTTGQSSTLHVGLENREGVDQKYEAVIEAVPGDGGEREELDRFEVTLADEQGTVEVREITPTTTGSDVHIQVHVYRGEAPSTTDPGDADLVTGFWVTVEE